MDVDQAHSKFRAIRSELEAACQSAKTEQDTRLQLIDRFLAEVLGWPRNLMLTEKHEEHGYVDYLLKSRERNLFVVEAKRVGKVLIDTKNPKFSHYKVGSPALRSAQDGIKQAREYCPDHGVIYAALTTGAEWIGFTAIRTDGKPVSEGVAFVFPTLQSVEDEFATFFDLFSYYAHLHFVHRIRYQDAEGPKVLHSDPLYTVSHPTRIKMVPKSPMATDMDSIFREFFESMSGTNPEMLAKCFVESKESREADDTLYKLAAHLVNQIKPMESETGDELAKHLAEAVDSKRGEFVLIIGNKGAGKSTFVDRFFRLVLDNDIRKKCLLIRVDLANSTGDAATLVPWLVSEIQQKIESELFDNSIPTYDELQGIFWKEYDRWRKGEFKHLYESDRQKFKIDFGRYIANMVENDKQTYVERLLRDSIRSRGLLPCLIFDNADHFPQSYQEGVFQYAQSIFRKCLTFVICPITDRTIWQLSKAGPFQSYKTTQFYLPVPSTKAVLSKRIDFIKEKLGAPEQSRRKYFMRHGIKLDIKDIEKFALAIEHLFVDTEHLGRIVGWISNHDIRRGLEIAKQIMTSPHIKMEDLTNYYITGKKPHVRDRHIMKSLILGDYSGFVQDNSSYILNCWETPASMVPLPLGKLSILRLLADRDSNRTEPEGSYMTASEIADYLEPMGMPQAATMMQLGNLLRYRLAEPYDPTDDAIVSDGRFRITHCGRIHMEFCEDNQTYMEQMALATPVRDENYVTREQDRMFGTKLTSQLDWQKLVANFVKYSLGEDKMRITIPDRPEYRGQSELRERLKGKWKPQ